MQSIRTTLSFSILSQILLPSLLWAAPVASMAAEGRYAATWESLKNYQVPEWYQDAKFGIWPVWGVYSVPAYRGDHAGEWYGRWMYAKDDGSGKESGPGFEKLGLKTAKHHRDTYGDPAKFGYKDLIPLWKAERWHPDDWAQLAGDSGAKIFLMIALFSDGFSLYGSDLTQWNSVTMGPHRDLVGDMAAAARKRGLKFGVSNHFAWNAAFFSLNHANGFDGTDPKYQDLYSNGKVDAAYVERWWKRTVEIADKFHPDLYYFDWCWNAPPFEAKRPPFVAHLYNQAIADGKGKVGNPGVVLNYKLQAVQEGCAVLDYERGRSDGIRPMTWQTDTSISKFSWGYSEQDEYYTTTELLHEMIDVVSKNGIYMLSYGPRADGTVPDEYKKPLLEIGAWLKRNGECIYATRAYSAYSDMSSGAGKHVMKPSQVRFTRNKANTTLYAINTQWPGRTLTLQCFKKGGFDASGLRRVTMLGSEEPLAWAQDDQGLTVTLPEAKPDYGHAYPIKFEFAGTIPPPVEPPAYVPTVEVPDASGVIALPASDAQVSGESPEYLAAQDQIGRWFNPSDFVFWDVAVPQAGTYTVKITYSCAAPGSEFTFEAAGAKLSGVSKITGSWDIYTTETLGEVTLAAGKQQITVKPKAEPTWKVIGLRLIVLEPK
jgi:alpha-L-fucosidase